MKVTWWTHLCLEMRWWWQWTPLLHVLHVETCQCLLPLVCCKLSTPGVLCYPKAFSLIGDVHDFHDHRIYPWFNSTWLCYESLFWVIASTSLGPRTWWHCFCFWVRTKETSTALLCGQRRCCWKEYRYLTTVDSFVIFDGFIKVYIKYHVDKETLCSSTWCRHENGFWKLSEGLVIAVNVVNKAHSIDDASWRLQYRLC